MWAPITLPPLPGRVAGVSEVAGARFAVWTDAGVHILKLKLGRAGTPGAAAELWETLPPDRAAGRLDPATGELRWRTGRYKMHGACGPAGGLVGRPLPTGQAVGQTVTRDGDRLLVRDIAGAVRQTIDAGGSRAKWTAAGFTGNSGEYLLVAHPGSVRLFRFAGSGEGGGAVWQRAGGAADHDALIRAVLAAPDDDLPRLVYADWLEEHGDPARAAFIRLQCRVAGREQFADIPFGDPDAVRAVGLEDAGFTRADFARWEAELPAVPGVNYFFPGFRGFPVVRFRNPDDLLKNGDRILAATPIEAVHFSRLTPRTLTKWLASPYPDRVARLRVVQLPDDVVPGLVGWLGSPRAARLRRLSVVGCTVPAWTQILRAVAASRTLDRLEKLDELAFQPDPPAEDAVLALARSPHLPRLRFVPFGFWFRFPEETKAELRKRFPGINLK